MLSGNRNFEGRINPDVKMNYLASPPLVVAYALAGTMDIDLVGDPIGQDPDGADVFLRDIWPSEHDIAQTVEHAVQSDMFRKSYAQVYDGDVNWSGLEVPAGDRYAWDADPRRTCATRRTSRTCRASRCRCATSSAPASWPSSATASRPTTSPRRGPSRRTRRPGTTS